MEGPSGPLITSLTEGLEPGAAVLAVLIEHAWQDVLDAAIQRAQGTTRSSDFTEHATVADAWLADVTPDGRNAPRRALRPPGAG